MFLENNRENVKPKKRRFDFIQSDIKEICVRCKCEGIENLWLVGGLVLVGRKDEEKKDFKLKIRSNNLVQYFNYCLRLSTMVVIFLQTEHNIIRNNSVVKSQN